MWEKWEQMHERKIAAWDIIMIVYCLHEVRDNHEMMSEHECNASMISTRLSDFTKWSREWEINMINVGGCGGQYLRSTTHRLQRLFQLGMQAAGFAAGPNPFGSQPRTHTPLTVPLTLWIPSHSRSDANSWCPAHNLCCKIQQKKYEREPRVWAAAGPLPSLSRRAAPAQRCLFFFGEGGVGWAPPPLKGQPCFTCRLSHCCKCAHAISNSICGKTSVTTASRGGSVKNNYNFWEEKWPRRGRQGLPPSKPAVFPPWCVNSRRGLPALPTPGAALK